MPANGRRDLIRRLKVNVLWNNFIKDPETLDKPSNCQTPLHANSQIMTELGGNL
jgi:hypothetical protein